MKNILLITFAIFSISVACKKEQSKIINQVNQSVELKKGLIKTNAVEGINIVLDSVAIDSRCALDVVCVWEGNAEATFTCNNGTENEISFILNTHDSFVNDTLVFGYRIKLIDLKPYPLSYINIDPEDYTAEILITKE